MSTNAAQEEEEQMRLLLLVIMAWLAFTTNTRGQVLPQNLDPHSYFLFCDQQSTAEGRVLDGLSYEHENWNRLCGLDSFGHVEFSGVRQEFYPDSFNGTFSSEGVPEMGIGFYPVQACEGRRFVLVWPYELPENELDEEHADIVLRQPQTLVEYFAEVCYPEQKPAEKEVLIAESD